MKVAITYAVIVTAISTIQYFIIKKRNKRIKHVSKVLDDNYKHGVHRANRINTLEKLVVEQCDLIEFQVDQIRSKDNIIKTLRRISVANIAESKAWEGHKE